MARLCTLKDLLCFHCIRKGLSTHSQELHALTSFLPADYSHRRDRKFLER
jgi:hypothetical protein